MKNLIDNTQVVILAGGLGSRLSELTNKIPNKKNAALELMKLTGKKMGLKINE